MFGNDNTQNMQVDDSQQAVQPQVIDPASEDTSSTAGAAPAYDLSDAAGTDNSAATAPAAEPAAGDTAAATPVANSDLLEIKQNALQELSPLVGHLDQTPEEKFRTIMMMIQASDDQSLVKDAYEAAKQITEEKARAQALLDVVNEINYFTQQHQNNN